MEEPATRALLVGGAVIGYYSAVVRYVGEPAAKRLLPIALDRLAAARTHSVDEIDAIVRLALAGAMQLCFLLLLIPLAGVDLARVLHPTVEPGLLALGVALGVAEAAALSQVGYIGSRLAMAGTRGTHEADLSAWLTYARGGWIRYYVRTTRAAPLWVAVPLAATYVAVEEAVFRGVLVTSFTALGAAIALAFATSLFVAVQAFHMPSWRSAMFPMLGASVIGVVHGVLYLLVPELLPLVIAHLVAFHVAVRQEPT